MGEKEAGRREKLPERWLFPGGQGHLPAWSLCSPWCHPHCPGLVSPALALDLSSYAWSSSRDTCDFAFGPHLCGENETHLPPRDPTPQRQRVGGHQERPLPCGVSPLALCPVFPAQKVPSTEMSTQLSSKSFICARLAPQCPRQGWEAGSKSQSTLSWGSSPHSRVSAPSCWPRLTTPAPATHSTPVTWCGARAWPGWAHLLQLATLTPLHSGHPGLVCTCLCQHQLESRFSWKHRANY